jgi:dGTPase
MTSAIRPSGTPGEDALSAAMAPYGGFDHNAQAIRIVTHLERHYAEFDGLNLTWEALEGIAKHNGPVSEPMPWALAPIATVTTSNCTPMPAPRRRSRRWPMTWPTTTTTSMTGCGRSCFRPMNWPNLPILDGCFAEVDRRYPGLNYYRRRHEALRRFFGLLVEDVLAQSQGRLAELDPQSARRYPRWQGGPWCAFPMRFSPISR